MADHKHRWVRVGGVKENPGVWSVKATEPGTGRGIGEALRLDEECECGIARTGMRYNLGGGRWTAIRWTHDGPHDDEADEEEGGGA